MSGVYIMGMEMPTSCYDCPFGEDVDIVVGVAHGCNLLKDFAQFADERHKDCPLVPVTDHGRLIDADDFFQTFPELIPYEFSAPTIIPADGEVGE